MFTVSLKKAVVLLLLQLLYVVLLYDVLRNDLTL